MAVEPRARPDWSNPKWIADRVIEAVPQGVSVSVRVSPLDAVEVSLYAPRWRTRQWRRKALVAAVIATSDSPAGLIVRTGWV